MASYDFQCPNCGGTCLIEKLLGEEREPTTLYIRDDDFVRLDGFFCDNCKWWLTRNGGLAPRRETTGDTRVQTHDQLLEWLKFVKEALAAI